MPPMARINAVAVSHDGVFAAAARGNRVTLYDVPLKQAGAELPADAHRDLINALAFSPDGSLLATGSAYHTTTPSPPPDAGHLTHNV